MSQAEPVSRYFNGNLVPLAGEYLLDPRHTFAEFIAQHVVVGHVRGSFNSVSGKMTMAEDPAESSVELTIDATSVYTHVDTRDDDLRSPRYLQVEQFPMMTFRSNGVIAEPDGRWTVEGYLTIRDVTRPVFVLVDMTGVVADPWGKTRVGIHAVTKINRLDFGLVTDLTRETGGRPVGSDVTIIVESELILQVGDK